MSRSALVILQIGGKGGLVAAAIASLAGCSDRPTEPHQVTEVDALAILSEPVNPASITSDNLARAFSTLSVTGMIYISLPPGSVPGGSTATIRNATSGNVLRVPVTDGGFDPVSLAASVGDEIVLEVFGSAGLLATEGAPVPPRTPPKVVRTVPPKGKTDVPLNSRIYVIFSEPVDGTSVSGAVQLLVDTTLVEVAVQLVGESGLTAEVIPAAPLDPETQYHLVVTQALLDRSGDALEAPVSVQFTTGPQSTGANTTSQFCGVSNTLGYSNAPIFFAVQNGGGPWHEVASSEDYSYAFAVDSGRGALAYVTQYSDTHFSTTVHYGTQQELNTIQQDKCPLSQQPAITDKIVHGRVENVGSSQVSWVNASGLFGSHSPTNETDFSLWSLQAAPFDLVALRYNAIATPFGLGPPYLVDAGIIRRDQNPVPNSTMPVLDFASAEAFAPVVRNLTINNLAGEQTRVDVQYRTAKGGFAWLTYGGQSFVHGFNRQYPGIPNAQPGDLHTITIGATDAPSWDYSVPRTITLCFKDAVDRTVTLPPHLGPVTVSVAATAPRVRLRFRYSLQPEFNRGVGFSYWQGSTTVGLTVSPGYLGTATEVDATVPDLTNLSGWNVGWGPSAGIYTYWGAWAQGWTGTGTIAEECGEGDVATAAEAWGSITP